MAADSLNTCNLFIDPDGTLSGRFPGCAHLEYCAGVTSKEGEPLEVTVTVENILTGRSEGTLVFHAEINPNPLIPQAGANKLTTEDGRWVLRARKNAKSPLYITRVHPGEDAPQGLAAVFANIQG